MPLAHVAVERNIKNVYGRSDPSKKEFFENCKSKGFDIKDFTGSEESTFSIGSPGVQVWGMHFTQGDFKLIEKHPERYIQVINVDIPALLPLNDNESFPIQFENHRFLMHHKIKTRGEEFYSTLDSSQLPYFSSLQFQGELFPIVSEKKEHTNHKSYDLIVDTLHKLNSLLDDARKLHIGEDLHFSYHIFYLPQENFPNNPPVAKTTFPYTGLIDIKSPDSSNNIDENLLRKVLSQKIKIKDFSETDVVPKTSDKEFNEKVHILTHDFAFYCSQHPESLQQLEEEHIRDLFLILAKAVFENAEGEPFHYDGKLDYKISNLSNKYEFITGEFKWWTGDKSFQDAFHQAVRKHATGQESCIYIIMLNKNKDMSKVYQKTLDLVQNESEFIKTDPESIVPDKSKQLFKRIIVNHRGHEIPLIIGMIDCYFQKQ